MAAGVRTIGRCPESGSCLTIITSKVIERPWYVVEIAALRIAPVLVRLV